MENSRLSPHFWTIITSWKTKISYSFKIIIIIIIINFIYIAHKSKAVQGALHDLK
jgi:hypothetical protein